VQLLLLSRGHFGPPVQGRDPDGFGQSEDPERCAAPVGPGDNQRVVHRRNQKGFPGSFDFADINFIVCNQPVDELALPDGSDHNRFFAGAD
jgi:hypothetical protein